MVEGGSHVHRRFASGNQAHNAGDDPSTRYGFAGHGETTEARRFSVPWVAVAFVAFTFLRAGVELAAGEAWGHFAKTYLKPPITFLMAWVFAGVGFKVRFRDVIKRGSRAFACGLIVALVSGLTGLALVKFLWLPHQWNLSGSHGMLTIKDESTSSTVRDVIAGASRLTRG